MRPVHLIYLTLLLGPVAACCASADVGPIHLEAKDFEEVVTRSRTENKHLLVAFLGEGWSVSSKKFKEAVLSSPTFKDFAERHLIYFPIEARRKPKLTSEETAVLQSWVIHFDIKSYPTLILIAPDGQELLRHGYRDLDAVEYINLLKAILPKRSGK